MGKGKTLDAIALIAGNQNTARIGPKTTLIVCSPGLLAVWGAEIRKHTRRGCFSVFIHHRSRSLAKSADALAEYDVVIMRKKVELPDGSVRESPTLFEDVHWLRVVIDKSHWLQNRQSGLFTFVVRLSSWYRLLIMGTPIHNKTADAEALLQVLGVPPPRVKSNLNGLLAICLLRKQKTDTGPDGSPLVPLPSRREVITRVGF